MGYKAVIFDLDGTLVNTLSDLSHSMNFGLSKLNLPGRTEEECREMIGNGVRIFAQKALPEGRQDMLDDLLSIMRAHYAMHCCDNSRAYDGISDVLRELKTRAILLAVITNKPDDMAVRVVEHYFGKCTFSCILGIREGRATKPDPSGTIEILDKLDIKTNECLFVGDSDVDIQTAKAAGIRAVGVSWGFRDVETLCQAGADVIIDKPEEILELIS